MTTQQPSTGTNAKAPPAPAPASTEAAQLPAAQQQATQQVQEQPDDTLAKLTYREIPKFKDQIRQLKDPTPEKLQEVVYGTVISLVQDVAVELFRLRGWNIDQVLGLTGGFDEMATRLEDLEALVYGQDSQLIEQDAELFTLLANACEGFVEHALTGTHDPEGRQRLDELQELCKRAKARIEEIAISDGDDDDDGGDAQPSQS